MPLRSRSLLFSVLLLHALVVARQALAAEAELTQSTLDIAAQDPFPLTQVATPWHGETVQDLWNEYHKIFRYGNRNAASHLWATFVLERSAQMSTQKLELMFSGFCAVSGSPVRPNDYNRYLLRLDMVNGKKRTGTMHYCCWPCVCDTQDFIRVDTKTVATADGPKKYHFAVLGNPCDKAHKLNEEFVQPFGLRKTTLAQEAAEVRCMSGQLEGATLSDNGFPIIAMFFDLPNSDELSLARQRAMQKKENVTLDSSLVTLEGAAMDESPEGLARRFGAPQPGRVRVEGGVQAYILKSLNVQDEYEWKDMCTQRAQAGYNSGMGEIFRKVAEISSPAAVSHALSPADV